MLGQAQECFVHNALRTNKGPNIVAVLAQQAHLYYEVGQQPAVLFAHSLTVPRSAIKDSLEALDDKKPALLKEVPRAWRDRVAARSSVLAGVAALYLARALEADKEHGEAIARLQAVMPRLQDKDLAAAVARDGGAALNRLMASVADELPRLLTRLSKENSAIYFKKVAAPGALPPPGANSMVKSLPLPAEFVAVTALNDPFVRLVPQAVRARVAEYTERRRQLLEAAYAAAEQSNAVVRSALQDMNLPGALDALGVGQAGGMPPELVARVEAVREKGGEATLRDLMHAKDQVAAEDKVRCGWDCRRCVADPRSDCWTASRRCWTRRSATTRRAAARTRTGAGRARGPTCSPWHCARS